VKALNKESEGKKKSEIDIDTCSMQDAVHEITGKSNISKTCGFLKLAPRVSSPSFQLPL